VSLLSLDRVSYRYPNGPLTLDGISLNVEAPQVIAIAGPNGAGKSTLLDVIAGQKHPVSGSCRIDGRDTQTIPRREFCRTVAHVPQQTPAGVPFTVEEVVLTGRTPHGRGLYENDEDLAIAEQALERTGIIALRHRRFSALSGGEKQRVLLAAAVCQQPAILLLDEPGAHLDPRNESWLWTVLHELTSQGCLTIVVTHHLALAAQHSDRVWLLQKGKLVADNAPGEALQPAPLSRLFGVPFHRHDTPEGRVFLSYGK
jgi:iron complex transport system ATP-binding protein